MKIIYFLLGCFTTFTVNHYAENTFIYKDKFGKIPQKWGERVTLISLSPDDKNRVVFVKLPTLSGNFEVRLQHQGEKDYIKIYRSADLSKPVGSERIIWTADNSKFALFGRFYDSEHVVKYFRNYQTNNVDILYLMYDLNTNKIYCHHSDYYDCLPISPQFLHYF